MNSYTRLSDPDPASSITGFGPAPPNARYRTDMCKMIVLLQQILKFIETEPNPEILREQSVHLINYIQSCCSDCKITYKKRLTGFG